MTHDQPGGASRTKVLTRARMETHPEEFTMEEMTDALGQGPPPAKKPEHAKVSMPCFGGQHQACTGECWGGDCECDCHEPLQKLLADGFRMQERLRASRDSHAIAASNANFKLYMEKIGGHI